MGKLNRLFLIAIFTVMYASGSYGQRTPGWLYTEGNKIKNSDGTVWMGRGVNMFTSRPCAAYEGRSTDVVLAEIDELVNNWGANLLRLCLVNNNAGVVYDPTVTTGSILTDQAYQDQLVTIAEHVEAMPGVYIIYDIWWDQNIDKHNGGVPADADLPEFIETWEKLTEILDPYPHVLFGICNEPLATTAFPRDKIWNVMNEVAKAIRAKENTNKHIILAPGIDRYGRDIDYYVNKELVYENGNKIENIVYESHVYNNRNEWQDMLFTPAEDIPALTGEFGPDQYMTLEETIEFMELSEEKGIPWTAWSYDDGCSWPDGAKDMLNDDGTITDWGEIVKTHILNASNDGPKVTDFSASTDRVYDNVNTQINFSATVTAKTGKTISSVVLDLSEIGGGSALAMDPYGDQYTKNYTVGVGTATPGVKTITLTATDSDGVKMTATVKITVIKLATNDLIIYNDANTLITYAAGYNGTIAETQTGGAYEGSNHYELSYDYTQGWAGTALTLKNRQGVDFYGYEAIQFACKIIGESTPDIILTDNNGKNSNKIKMAYSGNDYKVLTVPISSFTGVNLSQIYEIKLYVGGESVETGTLYFDDMRLTVPDQGNDEVTGVQVNPGNVTLGIDQTIQLIATVIPATAGNKNVSWTSSNPSVATVSATGLVTAKSVGNTTITVTTEENNFQATSNITVDLINGFVEERDLEKGFKIYPNPTSGDVTLKLPGIKEYVRLKVINMMGEIVLEDEIHQKEEFILNTAGLSKGIYVVSLDLPDNLSYKQLLVFK